MGLDLGQNGADGRLITLAVIGCGQRGSCYSAYALSQPQKCQVVAIAEPRPKTRELFAQAHKVHDKLVFNTWQDLLKASQETIDLVGQRLADAVIVSVQDNMHVEVVLAFSEQGYHILCEKPMATSLGDCIRMQTAVKNADIIFGMGHVLRYAPYTQAVTEVIRSGTLGELVNVAHVEPIGYYHFAHSYVRGNWAKEKESSFSLMTKCCHDVDLLCHWLSPATPTRVSSFGSLMHFRKEKKPAAAGDAVRCLDCPTERNCAYSAKKIYLDPVTRGNTDWPASTIIDGIPDIENILDALKNGTYGKCVYGSDNDVCDHQVVNIEFSSGATASLTMIAYSTLICERQTRLHFTGGEIVGDMTKFTVTNFRTGEVNTYEPKHDGGKHGGGDMGLIKTFVKAVKTGKQEVLGTDVDEILKSHLTVFAAESSRKEGKVVDCADFEQVVRGEVS